MNASHLSELAQWQRVHPIAVLYFAAQALKGLVTNIIVLVPMFIALRNAFDDNPTRILILAAALLVLFAVVTFSTWWAFQFRVHEQRVEIKRGVFKKLRLNIPFSKIQDIKIEQPFYYRFSNTRLLALDTAGSAKQEANLVALSDEHAQLLSSAILASKSAPTSTDNPVETCSGEENVQILNRRTLKDLILHGITNNRVWIIFGVSSPFIDDAIRQLDHWVTFVNFESLYSVDELGLALVSVYILLTVFAVFFSVTLLSVIGAIVTFYDYLLVKEGERLRRYSGLLTRYQVNLQFSRIQHIEYKRDWLDGLFGRVNLTFKQINQQIEGVPDDQRSLLVPSVTEAESVVLARHAYQHHDPFSLTFERISKRFMLKYSLFIVLVSVIVGTFVLMETGSFFNAGYVVLGYAALQSLIVLRWYRWGYCLDDENLYIRSGLFGVKYQICPLFKAQQAKYSQSIWQKRSQLASVSLFYASGSMSIPMLPQHAAYQVADSALRFSEMSQKPWM